MERKIVYFDKTGPENTEATLNIARQRAEELGIKTILVASTRGDTAVRAMDVFKGMKVVVVTHVFGMRAPNTNEFTDENRKIVESKGGVMLTTGHALIGLTRRPTAPAAPGTPPAPETGPILDIGDVIANTLRIFCAGIKVIVEIGAMAADAGLARTDEDVIAIAGSGRGADTAVVMRVANSRDLFQTRIKELLCKPLFPAVTPSPAGARPAGAPAPGATPPGTGAQTSRQA